jgi:hypothetical protein
LLFTGCWAGADSIYYKLFFMNNRKQSNRIENVPSGSVNQKKSDFPDDGIRNKSKKADEESVKTSREKWQRGLEHGSAEEGTNPSNRDKNDPPPAVSTDKDETLGVP